MGKEFELVMQEMEFPNDSRGVFDGTLLCLEFFVAKNKVAYDAESGEPMLRREDRRLVNSLIQGEFKVFEQRMEEEQNIRPLHHLDALFKALEAGLIHLFSPEQEIEFANVGIEGFIQVYNDPDVQSKHADAILAKMLGSLDGEMDEEY
ncbi:hypothetical protein [Paenilisteria rocourtiae]|uniref:Uncharacterized protein n=1 Tax=Listeria rocourtiae TaxID=647910 RepID=A0A4R6ZPH4_9LIST|nr:hypothetical protein [Listeria rocourtiae]EUJ47909.1 hypothetical protein PROCOU_07008 [Listeria rocourtiae FSL F6-920]MBC1604645.1 hypothetical protein [Listeria rocourtiae]TDR54463.1 hypothetical protein DFP96_10247 [Listeria rocourtiae]